MLIKYDYPGNIRELENTIEHAFMVCKGDTIQFENLPSHLTKILAQDTDVSSLPLEMAETEVIRQAIKSFNGNRQKAADSLGISRNTLWRKMKRYGITWKAGKIVAE